MAMTRAKRAPKLNFDVTQEHIDTAVPKDSSHCMIADAVAAAYPQAEYISVDLATIRFTDKAAGWRYIYLTPRAAQDALIAFDKGEKPKPFGVRSLRAAQMVLTGSARKARTQKAIDEAQARGEEPPKRRRVAAKLKSEGDSSPGHAVPIKVGGNPPPLGAVAGGAGGHATGRPDLRTGRVRGFGLRGFIE